MTVRLWDNLTYQAGAASFDVIMGYLDSPGAAHAWTDAEWSVARATGRPLWGIVFYGFGADQAVAQAKLRGCSGVVLDIEGQYTQQAIASGQPQAFGDRCKQLGFPGVVYGTNVLCNAVDSHFDGTWRYYISKPTIVAPKTAYQWNHQASYDESIADDWFANPSPGTQPMEASMFYLDPNDGNAPWRAFVDQAGSPFARRISDGFLIRLNDPVSQPISLQSISMWVAPDGTTWSTGPSMSADGQGGHPWLLGSRSKGGVWQWTGTNDLAPSPVQGPKGDQGPPGSSTVPSGTHLNVVVQ